MGKERPEFCREAGCPVFGMSGYCRLLADLRREGLSRRGLKASKGKMIGDDFYPRLSSKKLYSCSAFLLFSLERTRLNSE